MDDSKVLNNNIKTDINDITELKKTEEKIRKVAEEWRKTFDAISDFVFILDKDFKFTKINKAICDVLNKKPEELIGKRCQSFYFSYQ